MRVFPDLLKMKKVWFPIVLILFTLQTRSNKISTGEYKLQVPKGFPAPKIPEENQLTLARVELGKRLFYDPIMSRDSTVSCATCHKPHLAFTDGLTTSKGVQGRRVSRNAPTLTNVAYQDSGLLADRGVPSLEMQILVPVQEHAEFDFDLYLIAERMKHNAEYQALSQEAYGKSPDPYVITRSIASFERILISGNSKYDQFRLGDEAALNAEEKRGMNLFFNTLNCSKCHSGFNFTTLELANNGLYPTSYPLDSGKMRLTRLEDDRDMFKVPTLRNIDLTAPYMHDGSIPTLEEVIEHYDDGGHDHKNKSPLITPLNLTTRQKDELVAFLRTLTDDEFVRNPELQRK